ncbi:MAG: flagellar assembly peptidoglycan hydrolase FlgJ [Lysobacterales bacterium]
MQLPNSVPSPIHLSPAEASADGTKTEKSDARLHEAAQAFEGAFLKILLKSMRSTIPEGGLFDRQQMAAFEEMRDGALADSLSGRGATGIAQIVAQQLGASTKPTPTTNATIIGNPPSAHIESKRPTPIEQPISGSTNEQQRRFIDQLLPAARTAAKALGIDPSVIIAQAALETGWGQHVPQKSNGASSNNLFGVKSSSGWRGDTTQHQTTEFLGGKLRNVVAQFRAYADPAESVADYVELISQSKRYAPAVNAKNSSDYLKALSDGGYATDPDYTEKIQAILKSLEMRSTHDH